MLLSPPLPCTAPFPPLQDAKTVNEAVQYTSGVYEELAEMHSAQPKNDMIPALDVLKEYLGILGEFPDTQHLAKVRKYGCVKRLHVEDSSVEWLVSHTASGRGW